MANLNRQPRALIEGRAALIVSALNDNNPMVRLLVVAHEGAEVPLDPLVEGRDLEAQEIEEHEHRRDPAQDHEGGGLGHGGQGVGEASRADSEDVEDLPLPVDRLALDLADRIQGRPRRDVVRRVGAGLAAANRRVGGGVVLGLHH